MSNESHESPDAVDTQSEGTPQTEVTTPAPDHDYAPKAIVLAKVKGYPSWPAMVLDEAYLPLNIVAKKPKSQARVKTNTVVPIRFFSDDTYIWIKQADIKLLSAEDIDKALDKFANSSRKLTRKDRLLQDAFGLARDPPDMVSFVRWGSQGEPEGYVEGEEALEAEEEEEEVVQPVKKKQRTKAVAKSKAKPKAKGKPGPKPKAKPAPKPKVEEEEEAFEYESESEIDSDWGFDEKDDYDYEAGNYIFDDEKEQIEFNNNFPRAVELTQDYNTHQQQFNKINITLSTLLLEPDLNVKEIEQNITKLVSILKTLPKTIFLKSYLYRVLILVLHKPIEHFSNKSIRTKISKILGDYLNIEVKALSLQDLQASVEPEELNGTEVAEIVVQ